MLEHYLAFFVLRFYNGRVKHGKLASYLEGKCRCDECCKVGRTYFREYARAHPNPKYDADYRRKNSEAIKAREARYRIANKEKRYAYGVEYKRRNKEKLLAKQRSTAGKLQRRKITSARRARERMQFLEDVDPMVVFTMHGGRCGICGQFVSAEDFEVDHLIPIARGGLHGYVNVQPAHGACNKRKGAREVH